MKGALITLALAGVMIVLGLQWTKDPANLGGAVVLFLGYLVAAGGSILLVATLIQRRR